MKLRHYTGQGTKIQNQWQGKRNKLVLQHLENESGSDGKATEMEEGRELSKQYWTISNLPARTIEKGHKADLSESAVLQECWKDENEFQKL